MYGIEAPWAQGCVEIEISIPYTRYTNLEEKEISLLKFLWLEK